MINAPLFTNLAACAGKNTNRWMTEAPEQVEYAKGHCRICPARSECLTWALQHNEWGTWGGTTRQERLGVRGAPDPAPRSTEPRKPRRNLTDAQRELVAELTDEGWSTARIADEVQIHIRTVTRLRREARESA